MERRNEREISSRREKTGANEGTQTHSLFAPEPETCLFLTGVIVGATISAVLVEMPSKKTYLKERTKETRTSERVLVEDRMGGEKGTTHTFSITVVVGRGVAVAVTVMVTVPLMAT